MNLGKVAANIILAGALSACSWISGKETKPDIQTYAVSRESEIFLQEPFSRVVARCFASAEDASEACAAKFEEKGYVRLHNIPYKTARYDFLTKDTYPSRRWRFNERTPRW